MKKIIFICTAMSLFSSAHSMNKQVLRHPTLPLEFYKYAFGWIAKDAQSDRALKGSIIKFIQEREVLIHKNEGKAEIIYPLTGEHAYQCAYKLSKARKKDAAYALWQYGCVAGDMYRYAIRKNLGISNAWDRTRLMAYETWPNKWLSEEEIDTKYRISYRDQAFLNKASIIEEKTAHTIMKHFLQNPQVILEKHVTPMKD